MLSNSHKKFLERACGVAQTSEQRYKHGCVIVKHGNIISYAINSSRNRPSSCTNPETEAGRHAEQEAIRRAGTDVEGATLYVARVNRKGTPLLSAPCAACQRVIELSGIKKVVYTE